MTVFVDSYALIAWLNRNDSAHNDVVEYLNGYRGKLVTTEWILMEVADALAGTRARQAAIEFLQAVRTDPNYEVVAYDQPAYDAGFGLFSSYQDKDWSLTDCISFGVMRGRALQEALTGDKHFRQAGFDAVFE